MKMTSKMKTTSKMMTTSRMYIDEAHTALNIFPLRLQYDLCRPSFYSISAVYHIYAIVTMLSAMLNCRFLNTEIYNKIIRGEIINPVPYIFYTDAVNTDFRNFAFNLLVFCVIFYCKPYCVF